MYDFSVYDEEPGEADVEVAMEILQETDEVRDALERGMTLIYTGDDQYVDGRYCLIFALGTDHEDQFVREQLYAVCDNLVYYLDPIENEWYVLGVG